MAQQSQPYLEASNQDAYLTPTRTEASTEGLDVQQPYALNYTSSGQTNRIEMDAQSNRWFGDDERHKIQNQRLIPFGLTPLKFGLIAGLIGFLVGGGFGVA